MVAKRRRSVLVGAGSLVAIAGFVIAERAVWVNHGADGLGRASALASVIQTPLVVISVGLAAWQVILAARAGRQNAVQAAALERARSRPYVVVSIDAEREWPIAYLEVANTGVTPARDVKVTISPRFVTSQTALTSSTRPEDAGFLKHPIGVLAPGQRMTTLAEHGPSRYNDPRRNELPTMFNAHVEYDGDQILDEPAAHYVDDFTLDMEIEMDTVRASRKTVHDLAQQVEKIANSVVS